MCLIQALQLSRVGTSVLYVSNDGGLKVSRITVLFLFCLFQGQLLVLFGLSVQWKICFYMLILFVHITCNSNSLCSHINDDEYNAAD